MSEIISNVHLSFKYHQQGSLTHKWCPVQKEVSFIDIMFFKHALSNGGVNFSKFSLVVCLCVWIKLDFDL